MKRFLRAIKQRLKSLTQSRMERRHGRVGPPELWKMKRDFQIQFLKSAKLEPHHYFLDIGCGTLRGGLPVIDYLQVGRYYGVDVRPEVLDEARKELREAKLQDKTPTLLATSDIGELVINQQFDFIWAFSVLIHLDDDILHDTIRFVARHLSDDGTFYCNVNVGETRDEGKWEGFPVVRRSLRFYQDACAAHGLSASDIGSVKDHGHVSNFEAQDSGRMLEIRRA